MGKNVTVYIPNDMAEMMDRLKEVNWSEVCRKAIAQYVAMRTIPNIEVLVTRFKQERGQEYGKGYKLGLELSKELPYRELSRLVEGWEEKREEIEASTTRESEIPLSALREREWTRYWRSAIPGPYRDSSGDFIQGFADSVIELYKEVKGESLRSLLT